MDRDLPPYIRRIRELREDNDLNQTQVAEILHISQRTYSDYENGNLRLPAEYLITLAEFYNVDMNYISAVCKIKHSFPKQQH